MLEEPPQQKCYKQSECTPLFFNAYTLRDAGACIHSHSINAVLASMMCTNNEVRITGIEMIKGIRKGSSKECYRYEVIAVILASCACLSAPST